MKQTKKNVMNHTKYDLFLKLIKVHAIYRGNTLDDIQCLCMYPNRKHASYTYLNKYSSVFCGADIGLVTYGEKTLDNMQCLCMHPNKTLQNVTP